LAGASFEIVMPGLSRDRRTKPIERPVGVDRGIRSNFANAGICRPKNPRKGIPDVDHSCP
jgi:hypothetical protein